MCLLWTTKQNYRHFLRVSLIPVLSIQLRSVNVNYSPTKTTKQIDFLLIIKSESRDLEHTNRESKASVARSNKQQTSTNRVGKITELSQSVV